jgi:hypothetical protein
MLASNKCGRRMSTTPGAGAPASVARGQWLCAQVWTTNPSTLGDAALPAPLCPLSLREVAQSVC